MAERAGEIEAPDEAGTAIDGRTPLERFAWLERHALGPPMQVDVEATPEQLAALRDRVERSWARMGASEPHWSVLTYERFRADRIADTAPEFYATGERQVALLRAALARAGRDLATLSHAVDLGCGVGRVSAALARAGLGVTAVDVSAAHLDVARAHLDAEGLANVETRHLATLDDLGKLPDTDLVFSVIVLQHNPPPLMSEILRRVLARVRPGGLAYVQLPVYRQGYAYDVTADAARRAGGMEMHVLPPAQVFRILDESGFRPVEVRSDAALEHDAFESQVFLAERREGARPETKGERDG